MSILQLWIWDLCCKIYTLVNHSIKVLRDPFSHNTWLNVRKLIIVLFLQTCLRAWAHAETELLRWWSMQLAMYSRKLGLKTRTNLANQDATYWPVVQKQGSMVLEQLPCAFSSCILNIVPSSQFPLLLKFPLFSNMWLFILDPHLSFVW